MNRLLGIPASLAVALVLVGTSHAQALFTARLTGQQETPGVATPALGTGRFVLTSAGLQFFVTVEGLAGAITAAEFAHAGPGAPGPVVRDILGEFMGSNNAVGLWSAGDVQPLTATLISELVAGNIYVNIHSPVFPAGEIRGQVELSAGVHLTANLQGQQVNPPLGVAGTGTGSFTFTEEGLHYKITLNGLTGAVGAAHIHRGGIGLDGGAFYDITATFVGNTATGFIPAVGPVERMELLSGNTYLDIHTVAFPAGEIRGQINLAGGFGFSIRMDGAQETPPLAVPGLGSGSATLTPSGLVMNLTASGLTGAVTMAHIHRGPAGVAGPSVRDILPDFVSPNTARVLWRADDPMPMTAAMVGELFNNNLYVNLHTAAFPLGEIRGQLVLNTPGPVPQATYTANLAGAQEEPPVPIAGLGTGTFALTPGGLSFNVTVNGLTGPISSAHFHLGAIGVSGAVVRPIVAVEFVGPNTMVGTWTPADPTPFTAAMMTELFKGNLYFNVHTAVFPGGEIRGQILPASGGEFDARLSALQEVPPNATAGLGTGSLTLTPHGLAFDLTANGLTGAITAAHFHLGARGIAGGPVRTFAPGEFVGPTTLAGVWKPTDPEPLTPGLVTELLKGNLYVNLHTALFPGGEIRGQVTLSGGDSRNARPVGWQEVPAVATKGKATESGTLTDAGYVFRLTANDMFALPSAGRIQNAPAGVVGPVVRPFYPAELFGTQTADGVWKSSDADPFTAALHREMVAENLYINIITPVVPTGEIRGQIGGANPTVSVGGQAADASALQLRSAPNPVHGGSSTISFFLPRRSEVSLAVYDLAGAEVARLLRGPRDPGWHRVEFDAGRLASGVYFYRLLAGSQNLSGKMLVLR